MSDDQAGEQIRKLKNILTDSFSTDYRKNRAQEFLEKFQTVDNLLPLSYDAYGFTRNLQSATDLASFAAGPQGRVVYWAVSSVLWPVVKYAVTPSPPTNITRKFDPEVPEVTDAERDFYEPTAWASRTTSVLEIMEKRMEDIDNALEKHLPKEKGDDVKLKNYDVFKDKLTLDAIQKDESPFRLVDLPSDRFETFIEATRLTKIPPRDLEFLQMFQFLRIQEEYGLTEKEYKVIEKLLGLNVWTGRDDLKNKINKSDAMRFARGKYKV